MFSRPFNRPFKGWHSRIDVRLVQQPERSVNPEGCLRINAHDLPLDLVSRCSRPITRGYAPERANTLNLLGILKFYTLFAVIFFQRKRRSSPNRPELRFELCFEQRAPEGVPKVEELRHCACSCHHENKCPRDKTCFHKNRSKNTLLRSEQIFFEKQTDISPPDSTTASVTNNY